MIAVQEKLDWEVLGLYGLADAGVVDPPESVPPLALGQRAFEIVLTPAGARRGDRDGVAVAEDVGTAEPLVTQRV